METLRHRIESHYEGAVMGAPYFKTEKGSVYKTIATVGSEDYFVKHFLEALPPIPGGKLVWRQYPEGFWDEGRTGIHARAVVEE